MSARTAGMLTAGLAALALAAVPVTASAASKVKLKVSEQKNGPYVKAPGPNPLDVSTTGEDPKNLYLRASLAHFFGDGTQVRDHNSVKVRLFERLGSSPGSDDYHFQWFVGSDNISHDAQTSGYLFKLKEGHPQKFRVRVEPEISNPESACLFPLIEKNSSMSDLADAFFAINDPNACV